MTFSSWAAEWERTTVDLRPTTRDLYLYILRTFLLPTFGPMPMSKMTPLDVRAWLAELTASEVSAASAHRAFRLLRRLMNVAVQSEVIARSPCIGVKPRPVPRNESASARPPRWRSWPGGSTPGTGASSSLPPTPGCGGASWRASSASGWTSSTAL